MGKYRVGIVLSGGAARGFAHLGVLKALEEKGLKPEIISGVSAGAIAGAFYADGYSPEKFWRFIWVAACMNLFRSPFPGQAYSSLQA